MKIQSILVPRTNPYDPYPDQVCVDLPAAFQILGIELTNTSESWIRPLPTVMLLIMAEQETTVPTRIGFRRLDQTVPEDGRYLGYVGFPAGPGHTYPLFVFLLPDPAP